MHWFFVFYWLVHCLFICLVDWCVGQAVCQLPWLGLVCRNSIVPGGKVSAYIRVFFLGYLLPTTVLQFLVAGRQADRLFYYLMNLLVGWLAYGDLWVCWIDEQGGDKLPARRGVFDDGRARSMVRSKIRSTFIWCREQGLVVHGMIYPTTVS